MLLVKLCVAVFEVAKDRCAEKSGVRPNLVRSTCKKSDLDEGKPAFMF